MPDWVWYVIGAAGVTLVSAGAVILLLVWWRAQVRRYVVRLVGRSESLLSGYRSLREVAGRLADATDEELLAFAIDVGQLDRKALVELAKQQAMTQEDLETMALPKKLWPVAEALAGAARLLAREAGRVGEDADADEVLEGLASIELAEAGEVLRQAVERLHAVCEDLGVEDRAVYGGGLYI